MKKVLALSLITLAVGTVAAIVLMRQNPEPFGTLSNRILSGERTPKGERVFA